MGIIVGKKEKYSLDEILKEKADINIIFGGRNIGKSYQYKLREVIEKTSKNDGHMFGYIRRWDSDLKPMYVDSYFSDMVDCIKKATKNKWTMIKAKKGTGQFWYCRYKKDDEKGTGEIVWGFPCGYIFALNLQERYKSLNYPNMVGLVYEEWLTDKRYLPDEPNQLLNLLSTIKRDNMNIPMFMIANTISRVNPYIEFFGLVGLLRQKKGTIDLYDFNTHQHNEDGEEIKLKIACQYCGETDDFITKKKVVKQKSGNMISQGEWQSEEVPHLNYPLELYDELYSLVYEYNCFKFLLRFLHDTSNNNYFWYVERKTTEIKANTRIVSNHYYNSLLYTNNFIAINGSEATIFSYLRNGHVVFCDNLTGAEFKQCQLNFTC